jgi:hypothetical protein
MALMAPATARAHFIWIAVEPAAQGGGTVRMFLSETPEPGGPQFLRLVRNVKPTVDGQPLAVAATEETMEARWAGKLPRFIDAESDLGVKTSAGKSYRLFYTARAQGAPVDIKDGEGAGRLRVRLVLRDGKGAVQVLFDGKPVARARIKVIPEDGDARELSADEEGLASIDGLAEGKAALWANWVENRPGESGGKAFEETRYYATLTVFPRFVVEKASSKDATAGAEPVATAFATMPEPAVNSFGGAVLGGWLYVYSGHVGRTHQYSVETTSRHFRRLNLEDRTTWEELPMSRDVQGVALVSDGRYVYRVGGMSARNRPGEEHDLHSVADFARFDPETKTWTELAPLPRARSTHDAVIIGQTVYAVGGWTMKGTSEDAAYLDHVAAFDLGHPEQGWRTIPQPFRRRALSVAVTEGKLYALGGLNDAFKVERTVDVYDTATGTWSRGPDLPGRGKTDGFGTSAFGVEEGLYFSGASGRIFRLAADGKNWEAVGAWSLPRITHRLLPGPGRSLLAVGGNVRGKQTPAIERVELPTPARLAVRAANEGGSPRAARGH